MAKVSIIIPVYNTPEQYLSPCVESIKQQTETDWEIIAVDDGSEKKCAELLDELAADDNRIRVFHKANQGVSAARNFGLHNSAGEFITFVDSDDTIEPTMLQRLCELQSEHNADIVMCHMDRIVNRISETVEFTGPSLAVFHKKDIPMLQEMMLSVLSHKEKYVWHTFVCTVGKMYKSSIVKNIEFPINVGNGEDAIFGFKALEKINTMVVCDEPLYHYVQWDGSTAHSFNVKAVKSWENNRKEFYRILSEGNYDENIWKAYDMQGFEAIKLLLFTVFAHPKNNGVLTAKDFKKSVESEWFSHSIKRIKIASLDDLKSKLVLFLLKAKMYKILILLTRIRSNMISNAY